jgi:hypothetical protein
LVHLQAGFEYGFVAGAGYGYTAGNYFYGLQAGFSFGENDVSLKVGRQVSQGFETTPPIPFYGQLGYNRRF